MSGLLVIVELAKLDFKYHHDTKLRTMIKQKSHWVDFISEAA